MITNVPEILAVILESYRLPVRGYHGVTHWARVLENGLKLAETTQADVDVVTLFALFHDSRRVNEHTDPDHGLRGARLAEQMRGDLFELDDERFQLLFRACELHTDGLLEDEVTVQTCWGWDRLDGGSVGIRPRADRLCTEAARAPEMMEWAHLRGRSCFEPPRVVEEWGINTPSWWRRWWPFS